MTSPMQRAPHFRAPRENNAAPTVVVASSGPSGLQDAPMASAIGIESARKIMAWPRRASIKANRPAMT